MIKKMFIKMLLLLLFVTGAYAQTPDNYVPVEVSTTTLTSGATFTGKKYDARKYKYITVSVTSNQSSATDGVKLEQSCDSNCLTASSPTYQVVSQWSYTASSVDNTFIANVVCACARVRYVNGGTSQGSFFLRFGFLME